MKTTLFYFALIGATLLSLTGCVTVHDTLVLRNVEVEGSPAQSPVNITSANQQAGSVTASPHVSVGSGRISTSLEPQYDGPIDETLTSFREEGLSWNVPRLTYGMKLDYAVGDAVALNGGVSASMADHRQHTSGYLGVGLFSANQEVSFRFDLGLQFIDIEYTGATVVLREIDSEPSDTLYYVDRGKKLQTNLFATLTLNSSRQDRDVNWFFQLGITPQKLTSYVPEHRAETHPGPYVVTDLRAESSVFWMSATPGLYLNLPPGHRVLLGVRLMKEVQQESSAPGFLALPLFQFDWSL